MWPVTDFQRALDPLVADRAPRSCTRTLSDEELRMLVFAQFLRGSQYRPYNPAFVWTLRVRISRSASFCGFPIGGLLAREVDSQVQPATEDRRSAAIRP